MKAIRIHYLPPTAFKTSRLKLKMEGFSPMLMSLNGGDDLDQVAEQLARDFIRYEPLFDGVHINGFGSLDDGSWVATLGLREFVGVEYCDVSGAKLGKGE